MLHAGMTTLRTQRQSSGSMQQGPGVWSGSLSEALWRPDRGIRRCAAGTPEYPRCLHCLHVAMLSLTASTNGISTEQHPIICTWLLLQFGQRVLSASHAGGFCTEAGQGKRGSRALTCLFWMSHPGEGGVQGPQAARRGKYAHVAVQ